MPAPAFCGGVGTGAAGPPQPPPATNGCGEGEGGGGICLAKPACSSSPPLPPITRFWLGFGPAEGERGRPRGAGLGGCGEPGVQSASSMPSPETLRTLALPVSKLALDTRQHERGAPGGHEGLEAPGQGVTGPNGQRGIEKQIQPSFFLAKPPISSLFSMKKKKLQFCLLYNDFLLPKQTSFVIFKCNKTLLKLQESNILRS